MQKTLSLIFSATILFTAFTNLMGQSLSNISRAFSHPESVTASDSHLYVSNIGTKMQATAQDGDGFISKIKKNGEIVELRFLPKDDSLNAPKGSTIINKTLYVTDINRVVGYDLKSRDKVFELSITEAQFLNDIVAQDHQTLFVSATNIGKIARIDLQNNSYHFLDLPPVKGPNGLAFSDDKQTLFCVGFGTANKPNGQISRIDLNPLSHQTISDYQGYLDGVQYHDGTLFFSDWVAFEKKGVIMKLDLKSTDISTIDLGQSFGGPADFFYDDSAKKFYIPTLLENKFYLLT